ncbi:rRNA-processing protein fcf2 [Ophiocordyceps camponoti-floridani]|uniref:rRNA-processing protein fcf2 n=1 Tax=Ophiocordyceps camponoti-floridani TaxID=2030778 RepID=A0A8H4Q6F9_9HYPO|nr:rRNA-processing protein fcf2 [Ophiocordyceps camponoti-floridani]
MAKHSSLQIDEFLQQAEQRLLCQPLQHPSSDSAQAYQPQVKGKIDFTAGVPHTLRAPLAKARGTDNTKETTGPDWFHLPRSDLTSDFKRDWQLLSMRGLLDPKHQKKTLRSKPPLYYEQDFGQIDTKYSKIQRRKSSGKRKLSGG